ncbi:AraC family transcriptional regulator [Vagococcus fluvialis]|uniref:AraC family transcriptional regulator n=1 Tax=Vagococcus fluvialis TaxID=2738 RepID=UPI003D13DB12
MEHHFINLHCSNSNEITPTITNQSLLTMYFKRKLNNQILYTRIKDGTITSFEYKEFQRMHKNQDFELMYVLQGTLTNIIEDKEYICQSGEGCLLNTQISHTEELTENCYVLFLDISKEFLTNIFLDHSDDGVVFNFLRENLKTETIWKRSYLKFSKSSPYPNEAFTNILDFLQQELSTTKIGYQIFQQGLVLRLLAALENKNAFNIHRNDLDTSKEDHLVNQLIHLIENHFGNISRAKIEVNLHYNAEYLNRLLKKHTGKTITTYAKDVRLAKAQQLLTTTNHTIESISKHLGFANDTYFYYFFKKQTSLSPKEYQKKFNFSRIED